jgi:hypothetical protein
MKLPNAKNAVVEIEKLRDYCLSALHPEGRHKARVFLAALGISASDADKLREILLSAAATGDDCSNVVSDEYGRRYSLDIHAVLGSRVAIIRSAWIIKTGEDFPRLVSCYVLRGVA